MRGPGPQDPYGMPASPSGQNGDYGRPTPKQLNQNNTIVPNKSIMLEEDDEGEGYSEHDPNRESKRSAGTGIMSEVNTFVS